MGQIKRVRKTGFTVAPEAGSERLRAVINKDIPEAAMEETVGNAFRLGWKLIKLYFMIGLPTETEEDLAAMVDLIERLRRIPTPRASQTKITVSVSTFIPKAHTPFQWCPQISVAESKEKIQWLRGRIKGRGLRFKWHTPEMSILEGLWARGDRRLTPLLVAAFDLGCRFDGWSDHFNYEKWQQAIAACALDTDFYTTRPRDLSESLPWDHIDSGVSKSFLKEEWREALAGAYTADCREGECNECGVCDFETVQPVTFEPESVLKMPSRGTQRLGDKPSFKKLRVFYAKEGPARYFGHLELVKILMRALRRARIPLRYTQGYHPAPKVSFDSALPVGIESKEESFVMEVPFHVNKAAFLAQVNAQLPEGLTLITCKDVLGRQPSQDPESSCYTVTLKEGGFSALKIQDFLNSTAWPLTKMNRKGQAKTVDLKEVVSKLTLLGPSTIQMAMALRSGCHVSCKKALKSIFGLSERALALATIVKEPIHHASR
jgi:radical SAM-linked protein